MRIIRNNPYELDNGLPPRGLSLFIRFLVVSFPVLLVLGYMVFDLSGRIEQGILLRLGAGILLLYGAMLYLAWRVSKSSQRQEELIHKYAKNLEERVRQRTRELEESTQREIQAAKEVARLKDEFIFIAAHELRTPVAELKWTIDTIRREKQSNSLPPELQKHILILESSVGKLSALISDLLDVARLESFKITLEKKPVNLGEILKTSANGFIPIAKEKNVSLHLNETEFDSLPRALGDELKLQEVFNNLISNAIKFNHPGGTVEITAFARPPFAEVSVRDTGTGIKKEHFPKLFTKFFRAREDIEGTGLGLWIAKEIMRRLDGDIVVESEEGRGSTFIVKIPIAKT